MKKQKHKIIMWFKYQLLKWKLRNVDISKYIRPKNKDMTDTPSQALLMADPPEPKEQADKK